MAKVLYAGVFLAPASREDLFAWWREHVQPILLERLYGHHMTVQFKPDDFALSKLPLGEERSLRIIGYAHDDFAQAVAVETDLPCANPIPHVTVSTSLDTKPFYSNELLSNRITPVQGPTLRGVCDVLRKA